MKVQDVMTRSVATCSVDETLECAARVLWERDCGCVPVVDHDGRVVAMLTDRDVCMAAYTTGKALHELRIADAMSSGLVSCRATDDLPTVAARMAQAAVRRLPVVDAADNPVGILSINDLANAAMRETSFRGHGLSAEALRVLGGCSARRDDANAAAAAHTPGAAKHQAQQQQAQPAPTQPSAGAGAQRSQTASGKGNTSSQASAGG
jgi:CBS domain-containing protein